MDGKDSRSVEAVEQKRLPDGPEPSGPKVGLRPPSESSAPADVVDPETDTNVPDSPGGTGSVVDNTPPAGMGVPQESATPLTVGEAAGAAAAVAVTAACVFAAYELRSALLASADLDANMEETVLGFK
eukprot:SAG31_NODE_4773_length_2966_cov_1.618068_2_plen_128_part_00